MLAKLFSYKTPQNLLVLMNAMALFLIYFYREEMDRTFIIAGISLIALIYLSNFLLQKISYGDHYLFLIMGMLVSIGVIMIYRIHPEYGLKQILWLGLGILCFFLAYFATKKLKGWERFTNIYVILSMILFVATLIFGVKVKGATNWIRIAGFGFQPSEIIKILFVFFLASYYVRENVFKNPYTFWGIVYSYIGFLFIQKDLGGALLFFLVFITIAYIYDKNRKWLLYNLAFAALIGLLSYFFINHVRVRVITWLDPWQYIDSKGYQITQSLFAIASGGFFGTGVGLGHPEFIPEVHTDFIFSAICEEMGIFGGIAVIMLFMILVYRGFKIALYQQHRFFRIVALGITMMFGFQAFIILGGVMKMIPLTGVTLPFVSYGGSSLISSFVSLGILQVASEELDKEQEEEHGH